MPRSADAFDADLAACRAAMRDGSRSFDLAARFLPRRVRDPAVILYAFCRAADDLVDAGVGDGGTEALRRRLDGIYAGAPIADPADRGLARVVRDFAIPRALPDALIEGFVWDAEGRRYADVAALRAYAVRVAGTVGAMMALLMGARDPRQLGYAMELGVAMQFSNILRDVGEDARAGRLYLPLAWLAEAGLDAEAFLARPLPSEPLRVVLRRLHGAAELHYRNATAGIAALPVSCRFGIAAAGRLYQEIGREVARRDFDPVSARAVVPAWRKAGALRHAVWPRTALRTQAVEEAGFLLEAIAAMSPSAPAARAAVRGWTPRTQALRLIELFAALETRRAVT